MFNNKRGAMVRVPVFTTLCNACHQSIIWIDWFWLATPELIYWISIGQNMHQSPIEWVTFKLFNGASITKTGDNPIILRLIIDGHIKAEVELWVTAWHPNNSIQIGRSTAFIHRQKWVDRSIKDVRDFVLRTAHYCWITMKMIRRNRE